jgi:hypothetical protein
MRRADAAADMAIHRTGAKLEVYWEGRLMGTAVPFVLGHHVHHQVPQTVSEASTLLADAAALVGAHAAARAYYERALDVPGMIHFRPEIALTNLQLAQLPARRLGLQQVQQA